MAASKDSVAGRLGSMPWNCCVSLTVCRSWLLFLPMTEPRHLCPVPPWAFGSSGDPGSEALSWFAAIASSGVAQHWGVGRLLPARGELGPRGEPSDPELALPHSSPVSGEPVPSGSLRRRGDAVAACQDISLFFYY